VLSTELRILIRDTGRVWWRLLPLILGVYLLGWLGNELTLRIAVILGDISPWLALLLFAFSFVCTLTAAIVILTLAGESLALGSCYPKMSGKSTTGTPASPGAPHHTAALPRDVRRLWRGTEGRRPAGRPAVCPLRRPR
jgi:hypothetical protein